MQDNIQQASENHNPDAKTNDQSAGSVESNGPDDSSRLNPQKKLFKIRRPDRTVSKPGRASQSSANCVVGTRTDRAWPLQGNARDCLRTCFFRRDASTPCQVHNCYQPRPLPLLRRSPSKSKATTMIRSMTARRKRRRTRKRPDLIRRPRPQVRPIKNRRNARPTVADTMDALRKPGGGGIWVSALEVRSIYATFYEHYVAKVQFRRATWTRHPRWDGGRYRNRIYQPIWPTIAQFVELLDLPYFEFIRHKFSLCSRTPPSPESFLSEIGANKLRESIWTACSKAQPKAVQVVEYLPLGGICVGNFDGTLSDQSAGELSERFVRPDRSCFYTRWLSA